MRHIGEKDKAGCNEVKRERRDFRGDKARTPSLGQLKGTYGRIFAEQGR